MSRPSAGRQAARVLNSNLERRRIRDHLSLWRLPMAACAPIVTFVPLAFNPLQRIDGPPLGHRIRAGARRAGPDRMVHVLRRPGVSCLPGEPAVGPSRGSSAPGRELAAAIGAVQATYGPLAVQAGDIRGI